MLLLLHLRFNAEERLVPDPHLLHEPIPALDNLQLYLRLSLHRFLLHGKGLRLLGFHGGTRRLVVLRNLWLLHLF